MAKKYLPLLCLAIGIHLFGWYTLLQKIEPFMYYFYLVSWWSYILALDAGLAMTTGKLLVFNRNLPYLATISCAFWCLFELINIRLQNWFYINIVPSTPLRFIGYLVAFGTVIPGILVTKEALVRLLGHVRVRPRRFRHYPVASILTGFGLLILVLLFPEYLFALTWGFLALVTGGYNYAKGHGTFMKDLEAGSAGQVLSTLAAGMVCGLFWEWWNYWAISKWIYTVPFFERFKIFEMPLAGYLGFAAFSIETISFLTLLRASSRLQHHRAMSVVAALCFSLGAFALIDCYTLFSTTPLVGRLTFISQDKRDYLEERGVETAYAVDPRILNADERGMLALVCLKGLGVDNALKLREKGIANPRDLARLSDTQLASILGQTSLWRMRVFIRAAAGWEGT